MADAPNKKTSRRGGTRPPDQNGFYLVEYREDAGCEDRTLEVVQVRDADGKDATVSRPGTDQDLTVSELVEPRWWGPIDLEPLRTYLARTIRRA